MWKGKRSIVAILTVILAIAMAGCGKTDTPTGASVDGKGKLTVYTSLYPLAYAAQRIGGDFAEVKNLVPAGVEPHDFEPTAKDIVSIANANIFIYNGSGFEPWVEKAVEGIDKSKVTVVNGTEGLNLLKSEELEHHDGETAATADSSATASSDAQAHEHEHEHGEFDPHVWLDPSLFKDQAQKVKNAFVQADKAHSAEYEKNYQALAADLDALDKEFQAMAAKAPRKDFLTSHRAFGYLAHKYGLKQEAISGISPEDEPSPGELKKLVDHVKADQIHYVLFETLASPKVAEVIARETGAKTATLNPLEGLTEDEQKTGKNYLTIMRENLETLRMVLQ